jgi:glycosyltransferase involved in cell wall biosynthesis
MRETQVVPSPEITVAICTYNRAALLGDALRTLEQQETGGEFSFEILIVDDGSTDDTSEVIRGFIERSVIATRVVRGPGKGVGPARNRAVEESAGSWIVFMDDDLVAEREWLRELFRVTRQTGAAIVGGAVRLRLPEDEIARLSATCRTILGEVVYGFAEPRQLVGPQAGPRYPVIIMGGNVMIARSVFDTIGMFDGGASAGEDGDLWRRADEAGLEIWHNPKAMTRHFVPPDRLTEEYFKWNSMRWGNNFARRDWAYKNRALALALCLARVGHAAVVTVPRIVGSKLRGDERNLLHRKCGMWRAVGYARQSLFQFAPRLFPQERFFSYVDFRRVHEPAQGSHTSSSTLP